MARDVRFTALAARDVDEAFAWYEERRQGLGLEFEAALAATLVLLRQETEAGPSVHRDFRRVLLPRFPYALYYRRAADIIGGAGRLSSGPGSGALEAAWVRSNESCSWRRRLDFEVARVLRHGPLPWTAAQLNAVR